MRRIKYLFSLLALLLLGILVVIQCNEDILEKAPLGYTEETFFEKQQDYERAVYGIYAKLSDFYWFNINNPIHEFWHLPGDDITSTGDYDFEIFAPLSPANFEISEYWMAAYQLINRANTVLEKLETVEEGLYEDPDLRQYHNGEAMFLRGIGNFRIWNFFGSHAPLRTKRILSSEEVSPASSNTGDQWGTELLDQAISDFREAAQLLPTFWDQVNLGRATSNAAYGLLGKALVFRASVTGSNTDYEDAITAFNNITAVSLAANYGENFSVYHENNEESLFEFQATQPSGNDNVWLPNDFGPVVGSTSAYWGFYSNHWSLFGSQPFIPTEKLLNTYEPGDPRADYTVGPTDVPIVERTSVTKYTLENIKTQGSADVGSLNNPRILRYADVLLLKAEAINESGGSTSEAIDLINQIRLRARNSTDSVSTIPADRPTTETDRDQIFQWIMEERFLELAGEEAHRWWDLRRWHKAGKIDLSTWGATEFGSVRTSTFGFDGSTHLFYPIPNSETNANPNVVQNIGY